MNELKTNPIFGTEEFADSEPILIGVIQLICGRFPLALSGTRRLAR